MSVLDRILAKLETLLGGGLERDPQDYLYLDKAALYEHYKALTGMDRVPVGLSHSRSGSLAVTLLGVELGGTRDASTSFELSEVHLLESLEGELRARYPAFADPRAVAAGLGGFGWLRGKLSWLRVGPILADEDEIEPARDLLVLEAVGGPFALDCSPGSFSPFAPYLHRDLPLREFELPVEVLAYNSGVLDRYSVHAPPGAARALVLVPTVILAAQHSAPARERWIRERNEGALSRPYGRG